MPQVSDAPVVVETPPTTPKRKPKVIAFDDFCLKFFTSNEQGVVNLIRSNDLTQAAGGLCGIITKAYRAYRMALESGWAELGE